MDFSFDFEKMHSLLANFDNISGLRYSLSDSKCNFLCASNEMSPFCTIINSNQYGHQLCIKCDLEALVESRKQNKPYYTYRCHAGILNTVIPLNNPDTAEPFAYIYFGQMIYDTETEQQWADCREKIKWLNNEDDSKNAFFRLRRVNNCFIDSCAAILLSCYSYIWMDGILRMSNMTDEELLAQYIDAHYMEPITLDSIAKSLSVSKTKLCSLASKQGSTVMSMINNKRMEVAKKLLVYNNYHISDISFLVGINDYNYFSKVFRKNCGMSPREYRKQIHGKAPRNE